MKSDDDVEKLFSWLQTPDIRYREFADAREVADTLLTEMPRSKTAGAGRPTQEPLQAKEEAPDHDQVIRSEPASAPASHEPTTVTRPTKEAEPPTVATESAPSAAANPTEQARRPLDSVFNRLSGGRGRDRDPTNGRPR